MAVAAEDFVVRLDPQRGWVADALQPEVDPTRPTVSHQLPTEQGRALPLTQRTLDKARVTQLLTDYQDKAEQAEATADRLFTASLKLEDNIRRGKERSLPGIPLSQHPQIVQARLEWLEAKRAEEQHYLAWLHAINQYVGVSWDNRVEILELAGWYTGIVRTGKSYDFVTHRDGSAAQFNSRLKAVLWLHPVMLRHAPDATIE